MTKYGTIHNNIHSIIKQREAEQRIDFTYRYMAKQMGISTTSLLNAIHKPDHNLTTAVLGKLCWFLRCQPGDLLTYIPPVAVDVQEG